jgi:hypothetical protein
MKPQTNPDYDSLMTFLAETPQSELISLSQQPATLAQKLEAEYPSRPWGNVAPDSQEAQDGATADGERDSDAEETIYSLLEANPAA